MKKILLVPNPYLKDKENVLKEVNSRLKTFEVNIFDMPLNDKKDYDVFIDSLKDIDCLITLGGDGSLLKVCELAAKNNIPLLGINYGGTGYLTSLKKDELDKLNKLTNNEYELKECLMLDVTVKSDIEHHQLALNDVVIFKNEVNVPIKLQVNNDDIYYGDGLIVSTATGSSAYNYSAGGPLLNSDSKQIVLTPICPVGRKTSSKIYENESFFIKSIRDVRDEAVVSIDGFKPISINNKSTILISASKYTTKFIKFN